MDADAAKPSTAGGLQDPRDGRPQGFGCRVSGAGCRVQGVQGSGYRVQGAECRPPPRTFSSRQAAFKILEADDMMLIPDSDENLIEDVIRWIKWFRWALMQLDGR